MKNLVHSLTLGMAASILLSGLTGCAGGVTEDEDEVGSAASTILAANALTPNALTPNALTPNALTPNALNPSALDPVQDPGQAGVLSRQFLKYVVGCALDTTQSFSFSWTDSNDVVHHETYVGMLGLAPAWATGPLDPVGQRMVSACLGARTNYYGTTVTFSARSQMEPLKSNLSAEELSDYTITEGAFWGNVFSSTPYLNTCHRTANVSAARARLRDCAAGHLVDGGVVECGMIHITGDCESFCTTIEKSGKYFPSCVDHAEIQGSTATTPYVITSDLLQE